VQSEARICSPDREPCFIPSSLRLNTMFCQAAYGGKHGLAAAPCVAAVKHGIPPRGRCSGARSASRGAAASFTFICISGTSRKQRRCKYISRYVLPVMLCLITAFSLELTLLTVNPGTSLPGEGKPRTPSASRQTPPGRSLHGREKVKTNCDCRCKT